MKRNCSDDEVNEPFEAKRQKRVDSALNKYISFQSILTHHIVYS